MGDEDDIPIVAVPCPMPDQVPVPFNASAAPATAYAVPHQASSYSAATSYYGVPNQTSTPTAPSYGVPHQTSVPTAPSYGVPQQPSSFRVAATHQGNREFNQSQKKALMDQGYTKGLINELLLFTTTFSLRFWVVDNSGSMAHTDGNRLVSTNSKSVPYNVATCSRWKEIQGTIDYHAQLAGLLGMPTTFRLLNNPGAHVGPQEFSVATAGPELIQRDLNVARQVMSRASPMGVTPLAQHLREIKYEIDALSSELFAQGRKVAIILATDGLPSNKHGISGHEANEEFLTALRSLEGLPVWIVVRLCTDESNVVDFYNGIDANLELSIEVLDDFFGEASEVYDQNPWLNYTLPIHRLREAGIQHRLFDLLDERKFILSELHDFCRILFGVTEYNAIPDPEADFVGFMKKLTKLVEAEKKQYNPMSKKTKPIINLKEVERIYGGGSCAIM